jgi:hypothetical protein|nr:MAG TPA: hypothetical protein [Caudoviricetes sp.]
MEVFEVKEFRAEIKFSKRMSIAAGCALDDPDPVSLGKYSTKEEAMKELKKHKPDCYYNSYGKFYHVTEYFIDCYEADEDGEFLSGCDYVSAYEYKYDSELDDIVVTEA